MTINDMQAHVLNYLYSMKKPVSTGKIKSKLLGSAISFDDLFNSLFKLNLIAIQGNNIMLSDEGEYKMAEQEQLEKDRLYSLVFEGKYDLALLEFLFYRETMVHMDDFPEILKKHAPANGNLINDGPLQNKLLEMEELGYVDNSTLQWYGITALGKAYYRHEIAKIEIKFDPKTKIQNEAEDEFSMHDKIKMNQKLDQILEELSKVHAANEVLWTEMKADFEELRNLYGLSKKNWRQLLIGKMTEWTAGGIVSETLSESIVKFVKSKWMELPG